MSGRVYVALLNWRSWGDTIECLESIFRNDYPDYRVIVCDNNSGDRSIEHMAAWAEGKLDALPPAANALRALTHPPLPKPIPYVRYERAEAEAGGRSGSSEPPLIFIQTGANLGFSAGMNVALRYAMARGDFEYFWLLNMDTVVAKDALSAMVRRLHDYPEAGQCGSTLLDYKPPHEVQCLGGGTFNKWLIRTRLLLRAPGDGEADPRPAIEASLDFIFGASLLARKSFIEETGLLSEDYFLWNEEIDWSLRGAAKYKLAFAPGSVVYHKSGASTDPDEQKYRSHISDLCYQENKLTLAAKFFPWSIPVVYGGYLVAMAKRALNGDWDRVTMIVGIMARGLIGKVGNAERFRK
ncbi:MAG: glycosyltransferase family 2 protein [Alphaproteobacteria bacterium]